MRPDKPLNILLISPEPWGTCRVSKHHYAEHLAALGNEVYFLAPSVSELSDLPRGIHLVTPPRIPRGLRYYPSFWRKRAHRQIGKRLSKSCGVEFDRVWSFDTSWLFDLEAIAPKAFRILHLVDLSMEFEWKIAASQANLCLGSSWRMRDRLKEIQPNSHFIHHGYTIYPTVDVKLEGDRPQVVYAGNLTISYLDHERLIMLLDSYPDCDFHFYGDQGSGNLSKGGERSFLDRIKGYSNVHLHESVEPEQLASIYRQADVLLVCYHPDHREQVSNPHKVMEYLGSGKPILSNVLEVFEEQKDLIAMEDDPEKYVSRLAELIAQKDPELEKRRMDFAKQNTYLKQIQRIESLIQQSIAHE